MIVFIHIPKTAGTTFYDVVKKNHERFLKPKIENEPNKYINQHLGFDKNSIRLPGGYVTAPKMVNILKESFLHKFDSINFIGGHIGYGLHEFTQEKIDYISFIREPKSRLISDFKEHHKPGRFFYKKLQEDGFKFNNYLKLLLEYKLDNLLTRQLAGPSDFFLKDMILTEDMYGRAIKNSKEVSFFDINKFDEAIYYMCKKYKWKSDLPKKQNISENKLYDLEYDESILKKVIFYDILLYKKLIKKVKNDFKISQFQKMKLWYNSFI